MNAHQAGALNSVKQTRRIYVDSCGLLGLLYDAQPAAEVTKC
jgi:hypothetical protein